MKRALYIFFIVFGLMMTMLCADFAQTKMNADLADPLIHKDNDIQELQLMDVTGERAIAFFDNVTKLAEKMEVNLVFNPSYSKHPTMSSSSIQYYYSYDHQLNAFLDGMTNDVSETENMDIYSQDKSIEGARVLLRLTDTRILCTYIPLNQASLYELSTLGSLAVIGDDEEKVGLFINAMVKETGIGYGSNYSAKRIGYATQPVMSILSRLQLNFQFVYVSLIIVLITLYIYILNAKRREMVIRKTLGYSNFDIIRDMIKCYVVYPLLVSYSLFPFYVLMLGLSWNTKLLEVFAYYTMLFFGVLAILLVIQLAVFRTLYKLSNIEILHGRKSQGSFGSIALGLKIFLIPATILISLSFSIVTESGTKSNQLYDYYDTHLQNYRIMATHGSNVRNEGYYDLIYQELKHESIFALGSPIYLSGMTSGRFGGGFIAAFDSLMEFVKYRIDISSSFMEHFNITDINGKPINMSKYTYPTLFISENVEVDEKAVQKDGYQIVRVKQVSLPNFYVYKMYREPELNEVVLEYRPEYDVINSDYRVVVDMNKISETELEELVEAACQKLKISNTIQFVPLARAYESEKWMANKMSFKEIISVTLVLLTYTLLSLFITYIYFSENKRKLSLETIHGYSLVAKYRLILLANGLIGVLGLILLALFFDPLRSLFVSERYFEWADVKGSLTSISLAILIIDSIIIVLYLRVMEKRSLLNVKRK